MSRFRFLLYWWYSSVSTVGGSSASFVVAASGVFDALRVLFREWLLNELALLLNALALLNLRWSDGLTMEASLETSEPRRVSRARLLDPVSTDT